MSFLAFGDMWCPDLVLASLFTEVLLLDNYVLACPILGLMAPCLVENLAVQWNSSSFCFFFLLNRVQLLIMLR